MAESRKRPVPRTVAKTTGAHSDKTSAQTLEDFHYR